MTEGASAPLDGCDARGEACCVVVDGKVVSANPSATALLGAQGPRDLAGVEFAELVPHDQRRLFSALLARAAAGSAARPLDTRIRRPNGSSFDAECSFAPAPSAGSGAVRLRIRDVSLRPATTQALQEINDRKDQFLAAVAHELRNPLAPLRAALDVTLRSPFSDPRVGEALSIMDRQLDHLSVLVDDLVDVSQAGNGKLALARQSLDLSDVLEESIAATRQAFIEHNHVLELDIAPPADHTVDGDFSRLVQVFTNLLSNSAKYTPAGGTIRVDLQRSGAVEVVTVTDNGVGIAPEGLHRLFEPFERLDKDGAGHPAGMGIGMTVANQLVKLHGGRIDAGSDGPGQGSTFQVSLPHWAGQAAHPSSPSALALEPPAEGRLPRHRILIADDDPDVTEALRLLLETLGQEAQVAHDGNEAIDHALAEHPDLILLDLSMPGTGGLEVARRLRATLGGDDIRIAALTGHCQPIDHERTRAAGFDWHFVKPVTSETLLAALSQIPPRAQRNA